MSHRRCPIPHSSAPRGECRWCGEKIVVDGKQSRRLNWHPECAKTYHLHAFMPVQRRFLSERQGGRCAACQMALPHWHVRFHAREYTAIYRSSHALGEVDHVIPLWKVRTLDAAALVKYFGPDNLQMLCKPCHVAKTAREAGERAHFNAMAKKAKQPARKGTMRSRGFDKRFRRKMNGTVEKVASPKLDMDREDD